MGSQALPMPTDGVGIATYISDHLDFADVDRSGTAFLSNWIAKAAGNITGIYRREGEARFADALDSAVTAFSDVLRDAREAAEYETVTEEILRGIRKALCPVWPIC